MHLSVIQCIRGDLQFIHVNADPDPLTHRLHQHQPTFSTSHLTSSNMAVPQSSMEGTTLSRAVAADIPRIESIVRAAYTKYIPRIGTEPAPMKADYGALLTTHDIFALRANDVLVGAVVLKINDRSVQLNNLTVDPECQGKGYGKVLMRCADDWARENGCDEVVLYTNVKMVENFGLYAKLGYTETGRGMQDGYERAFFRKAISSA